MMSAAWRALAQSKLYWGLLAIFGFGVLFSPMTSRGHNIFLSYGNLTDVLRQVSITGLVAVGMTNVILIAGIDLSVGSIMGFGSVCAGLLLTQSGWTSASGLGIPTLALVAGGIVFALIRFVMRGLNPNWSVWPPAAAAVLVAAFLAVWTTGQVEPKFGVVSTLMIASALGLVLGATNGLIIVYGRLQPFIVTLAAMVSILGVARLTAGQDSAVLPIYPGSNSTQNIDTIRSMIGGVFPAPGLFFVAAVIVSWLLLRFTVYGRYVYAIGGNEEAARLSGIPVDRVKIATFALSGFLAGLAGVLYAAQYRQGKPDAGSGLELDAIAAVVIGGTSLMGGRGGVVGSMIGVLIFGFLSDILQLHNIDSNLQLVLKGLIIVVTVLLQERHLPAYGRVLTALHQALGRREIHSGGTNTAASPAKTEVTP